MYNQERMRKILTTLTSAAALASCADEPLPPVDKGEQPTPDVPAASEQPAPGRERTCPVCQGGGSFIHGGGVAAHFTECPLCKGEGKVVLEEDACPQCGGLGHIIGKEDFGTLTRLTKPKCTECKGSGKRKK